jgi:predicted  nucleic acid-binding Zn-ribbon protein
MKNNQTTKIIYLCTALGFAVTTVFGQTEASSTDKPEAPQPAVKEQKVGPVPSKKEEAKSQKPQIVWNGGVMIEEQNKLIRTNQNKLVKSLDSIVNKIQNSNEDLEQSIKSINQQQESVAAQLLELSRNLDKSIKGIQSNTTKSTNSLNKSLNEIGGKVEGLTAQIASNQEEVKVIQQKHSELLNQLSESTSLANKGVSENKALLSKIQGENSQIQSKIAGIENEIVGLENKAKENHTQVEGALGSISSKLALSFVLKTIVIIAALGLGFYVWKNKRMISEILTGRKMSDQTQVDTIFTDERYVEGLNRVINLLSATQQAPTTSQEIDHGLPLSVADEINRMRVRLSKMEKENVKVKPLQKALERMEEKLESMGYVMVDLIGKPYIESMSAKPTLIPTESLSSGDKIITRVITPQVSFNGKLIQVPEIEVSIGG